MVIDSNRRISDVAKELGLRSNLLRIWKKRYESGKLEAFPGKCHLSSEDSEIRRLKRENERLRMKRDILKKAVTIFGGQVMRYEFIKQFREAFPVVLMCKVGCSGFYAWLSRAESPLIEENKRLVVRETTGCSFDARS